MQKYVYRLVAVAAMFGVLCGVASAQRGGRDRGGRNLLGGNRQGAGTIVEDKGNLFVVSGSTLALVDVKTFKAKVRVDLDKVGRDADGEKADREAWIARFDENKDGALTEDDGRAWRWVRRYDTNEDNQVTPDEAAIQPAPGASGPVILKVVKDHLIMMRAGMLFKFDAKTLKLLATEKVVLPKPKPEAGKVPAKGTAPAKPDEKKEEVF